MDVLPVEAGTYAVIFTLEIPQTVTIGRLGTFDLTRGYYLYVGSAQGAGGLRARLGRHLQGGGQPHWHVDYLRKIARVSTFGYLVSRSSPTGSMPLECQWSQLLTSLPGAAIPIPKFGASDCRSGCRAHLVNLQDLNTYWDFARRMGLVTWRS